MYDDKQQIKTDLAIEQAGIDKGIQQMADMVDWLEKNTSVSFNWRGWIEGYDECPVEDHSIYKNGKALFAQMINLCPSIEACIEAWLQYSEITGDDASDTRQAILHLQQIGKFGNVWLSAEYVNYKVVIEVNLNDRNVVYASQSIRDLANENFNGMAVWVNGELEFQYGYPHIGPNSNIEARIKP